MWQTEQNLSFKSTAVPPEQALACCPEQGQTFRLWVRKLACAWGPVEQDALWRLDADAQEELRVHQRQLYRLPQLADLLS